MLYIVHYKVSQNLFILGGKEILSKLCWAFEKIPLNYLLQYSSGRQEKDGILNNKITRLSKLKSYYCFWYRFNIIGSFRTAGKLFHTTAPLYVIIIRPSFC